MMTNFNQAFFASASSMVELSLHSYKAAPFLNQNHRFYSLGIIIENEAVIIQNPEIERDLGVG